MMASAVSVFANHGTHCPTKVITKIVTRDDEEISLSKSACNSVVDQGTADTAALMLTNVIDGGIEGRTGARMSLGREAGGKTGTTNDSAAVWLGALEGSEPTSLELQPSWALTDKGIAPTFVAPPVDPNAVSAQVPGE
jgi:membrane peptidoglycan carboxypeptidase